MKAYADSNGDGWHHQIEITQVIDHDPRIQYPVCIVGENFKTVLVGKNTPEKNELLTWVGGYYNPNSFDPNFVNRHFLWAENDF